MSAANDPVPRVPNKKSSKDSRPSSTRHTLFLPFFILLLGLGTLKVYQVMAMEDQLDDLTQHIDKLDPQVKAAQYERAKFFKMANEVLRLSSTDDKAKEVATYFKLKDLQIAQPELMNMDNASDIAAATTNAAPSDENAVTNAAPASSTNATPAKATIP